MYFCIKLIRLKESVLQVHGKRFLVHSYPIHQKWITYQLQFHQSSKSAVIMNILLHTSQWYARFFKKRGHYYFELYVTSRFEGSNRKLITFYRHIILQESMIPYHCDLCDTKFISKQLVFEVHQKENKPWIMRNSSRKHDSIPLHLHCEI